MDQTDQTTQPVTPDTNTQPAPAAVAEKKQSSMMWVLLILVLIAIALALIISATTKDVDGTSAVYTEETVGNSAPVPAAGENPEATAEESAAIRSDLEMNTFDGTSDGI